MLKHLIKVASKFDISNIPAPEAEVDGARVHINSNIRNFLSKALREISLQNDPSSYQAAKMERLPKSYANVSKEQSALWNCTSWYGANKLFNDISREMRKYPDRASFFNSDYWKDIESNWDNKVLAYKVQELKNKLHNIKRFQEQSKKSI